MTLVSCAGRRWFLEQIHGGYETSTQLTMGTRRRALPFTMGTAGSDSDFQDCASPTASASGLMGAFLG